MATILCIDDEDYLLEDLAELMESCGHKAIKANDGQKGLQMILHLKPDLVISDISMPGMSGLELLRELRGNYPEFAEMPVILLSAFSDRKQVLKGFDEGADDYLTKPVDFELLDRKVKAILRQVDRIKKKNEGELIKLVESLSGTGTPATASSHAAPKESSKAVMIDDTPGAFEESVNTNCKPVSPKQQKNQEIDWRDSPDAQTVYGSTLNVKKSKNKDNYKNPGLMQWVAQTTTEIVKQLFPDKGAVAMNQNGGVYVCYSDADEEVAASRNRKLTAEVENQLKNKNIPKPVSEEDILDLTLVSEAPYQAKVRKEDMENPEKFSKAVQQEVTLSIPKIETVSDLMNYLDDRGADIILLNLLDRKGRALPINFYNFNQSARELISAGFTSIDERDMAEAGYKIDTLFLKLIANKIPYLDPNEIVMLDVHYTTLIAAEFQRLYIPKVKELTRMSKTKLILNIRGVTKASKSKPFKEVLKPLGTAAKGCTIQITPDEFVDFISSPLPVSGIVTSYLQTDWSEFSADLVHKARASLTNSRIPMIVRGVPNMDYINKLQKFGFDGYGITEN